MNKREKVIELINAHNNYEQFMLDIGFEVTEVMSKKYKEMKDVGIYYVDNVLYIISLKWNNHIFEAVYDLEDDEVSITFLTVEAFLTNENYDKITENIKISFKEVLDGK